MSYDLHGTWNKGNKWLGNFLNAHTNMTEITDYLDLFWRNDIDPYKMNLGLAFYSRTFTVSDTSCTEPQCLFDSGGDPGPCTQDLVGGTLSLAEITDLLPSSTEPKLDEAAMVKMTVSGGNRWIAYDDGDTWALKIEAALKQCFGGVMVWAVSQDIPATAKYTMELAAVTGWISPDVQVIGARMNTADQLKSAVARPQCTWSDCGGQCPIIDGGRWTTIWRADSDGGDHGKQLMTDSSNCPSGMGERLLCCPPDVPKGFSCGWWSHNGGWCDGNCPTGYAEVGSYSGACKNGDNTGRYQAACCTVKDTITHVFGDYHWEGTQDNCAFLSSCPPDEELLFSSSSGSGAVSCYSEALNGVKTRMDRNYCQSASISEAEWTNCKWYSSWGSTLNSNDYTQKYCAGGCPSDMTRLALRDEDCQVGAEAYCCTSSYRSDATMDELVNFYAKMLDAFYADPTCPTDSSIFG